MKNKLGVFICCAVMLLVSSLTHAVLYVAEIKGNPQAIEIRRNGKTQPPERFMALKEGDVIRVSADKTSLTLLKDDRTTNELNRSNTPYTVPQLNQTQSAVDKVFKWLTTTLAQESKKKPSETFTRSGNKKLSSNNQKIMLLGINPHGDNWVTLQSQSLDVTWKGGQPPFTIRLLDEQNTILEEQRTQEYTTMLDNKKLQVGKRYRVEVSDAQPSAPDQVRVNESLNERTFTIITADKLPTEIQQLDELPLSADTITQLKIAHLALIPEWRFQAFQEAQGSDMELIRQKILTLK